MIGVALLISTGTLLSPWIFKVIKRDATAMEAGNIAITIGIMFTFAGISIGLYNFDSTDIDSSVPAFLAGLQTAFFSSVAGIVASIIVKAFPDQTGFRKTKQYTNVTIATLAEILSKIELNQKEGFEKMTSALTGDEEGTLLTQMQKLRTTYTDKTDELKVVTSLKLDQLNESFNDFAEKVVDDTKEQLIEALKEVINDFNVLITDQIGDNFKHLNEGVEKLVDWQTEYKEQVELMVDNFGQTVKAIDQVSNSFEKVSKHSERFSETSDKLDKTVENIVASLGSFAELGERAKNSLPDIEKSIEGMTNTLGKSIDNMVKTIEEQGELISETQQKIGENTNGMISQLNSDIRDQFETLDEALGDELTKALQSLGNQLASLSEKFVHDYEPLTRRLSEVVRIAEKLDQNNGRSQQ